MRGRVGILNWYACEDCANMSDGDICKYDFEIDNDISTDGDCVYCNLFKNKQPSEVDKEP